MTSAQKAKQDDVNIQTQAPGGITNKQIDEFTLDYDGVFKRKRRYLQNSTEEGPGQPTNTPAFAQPAGTECSFLSPVASFAMNKSHISKSTYQNPPEFVSVASNKQGTKQRELHSGPAQETEATEYHTPSPKQSSLGTHLNTQIKKQVKRLQDDVIEQQLEVAERDDRIHQLEEELNKRITTIYQCPEYVQIDNQLKLSQSMLHNLQRESALQEQNSKDEVMRLMRQVCNMEQQLDHQKQQTSSALQQLSDVQRENQQLLESKKVDACARCQADHCNASCQVDTTTTLAPVTYDAQCQTLYQCYGVDCAVQTSSIGATDNRQQSTTDKMQECGADSLVKNGNQRSSPATQKQAAKGQGQNNEQNKLQGKNKDLPSLQQKNEAGCPVQKIRSNPTSNKPIKLCQAKVTSQQEQKQVQIPSCDNRPPNIQKQKYNKDNQQQNKVPQKQLGKWRTTGAIPNSKANSVDFSTEIEACKRKIMQFQQEISSMNKHSICDKQEALKLVDNKRRCIPAPSGENRVKRSKICSQDNTKSNNKENAPSLQNKSQLAKQHCDEGGSVTCGSGIVEVEGAACQNEGKKPSKGDPNQTEQDSFSTPPGPKLKIAALQTKQLLQSQQANIQAQQCIGQSVRGPTIKVNQRVQAKSRHLVSKADVGCGQTPVEYVASNYMDKKVDGQSDGARNSRKSRSFLGALAQLGFSKGKTQ